MGEKSQENRAVLFEGGNVSTEEDRPKARNLQEALKEFEKQLILDALKQNLGHRGNTAAALGIDRKTLYTKLKKYGVI
jgi:two-component system response regulator AtoC